MCCTDEQPGGGPVPVPVVGVPVGGPDPVPVVGVPVGVPDPPIPVGTMVCVVGGPAEPPDPPLESDWGTPDLSCASTQSQSTGRRRIATIRPRNPSFPRFTRRVYDKARNTSSQAISVDLGGRAPGTAEGRPAASGVGVSLDRRWAGGYRTSRDALRGRGRGTRATRIPSPGADRQGRRRPAGPARNAPRDRPRRRREPGW